MSLSNLFIQVNLALHPYKKSSNATTYELISDICGTTPDRVYKIAHGAYIRSFEDSATLTELQRRGIVRG